ncbi:MAG: GNAT family N-acetyltransferase [Saprospiraceae bacterium]|nr:GNAT family N-acetyltransferase [Saprospiraceae bacterium]
MNTYSIRKIRWEDNAALEQVIKTTLKEYGGDRPGTAYNDPSLSNMTEFYTGENKTYLVIEYKGQIVGGGGIAPLKGADSDICEFQNMYISKAHRGNGLGYKIVEASLAFAKGKGYKQCYIETFAHMHAAQALYTKFGFEIINGPLGNTGHSACDVQMLKSL